MSRASRATLAVSFALCAMLGAAALDFGASLSNDSLLTYESAGAENQSDRLRAWFSLPLGEECYLYLSGFYEFAASFQPGAASINPLRLDLERTDLEGWIPAIVGPTSMLRYTLGRAPFADTSSRILSGLSDGAQLELSIGNISMRAVGGYRGLLYKLDALSAIDAADMALLGDPGPGSYFAPARAFAALGLTVAEFATGYDAGLEVWGQLDLGAKATPTHTGYLEPWLAGKVNRNIGWRLWGIAELGYDSILSFAAAGGGQVNVSVPELLGLRLSAKGQWASGAGGGLRAFTPIRSSTLGSVSLLSFSDAFSVSLEAYVVPLRGLNVGLSTSALFRSSDNPPGNGTVRALAEGPWLGLESSLQAAFQLLSDLSLSGGIGVFLPNSASVYTADSPPRYSASLSAGFSL